MTFIAPDHPMATAPDSAPRSVPRTVSDMTQVSRPARTVLDLESGMGFAARGRMAIDDVRGAFAMWRLAFVLAWLDIKLRYRGSLLGPFWLTLSTGVMVGALGVLYAELFKQDVHKYLPFLALSLVLWNFLSALVMEACTCITQSESLIRSARIPYTLHAMRSVIRNILVLGHNIVVIVVVFAVFHSWPGGGVLAAVPALLLWTIDALALSLLLGAVCARFRDVPPIVGSVMQIAFFVSAIIWTPSQVGGQVLWLQLNPFFALMQIVRGPLLGELPLPLTYASALGWSALILAVSWLAFSRARGRLAFWM